MLRRQPSALEWASFNTHPLFMDVRDNVPTPRLQLLLVIGQYASGQTVGLDCFWCYVRTKHWCKARWCGLRSLGGWMFRARGRVNSKRARDVKRERGQSGLGGRGVLANMT